MWSMPAKHSPTDSAAASASVALTTGSVSLAPLPARNLLNLGIRERFTLRKIFASTFQDWT
jgi:hypothetical protein